MFCWMKPAASQRISKPNTSPSALTKSPHPHPTTGPKPQLLYLPDRPPHRLERSAKNVFIRPSQPRPQIPQRDSKSASATSTCWTIFTKPLPKVCTNSARLIIPKSTFAKWPSFWATPRICRALQRARKFRWRRFYLSRRYCIQSPRQHPASCPPTYAGEFLYWSVIQRGIQKGLKTFDLGRSLVGSGNEIFRMKWSPRKQLLAYWYWLAPGHELPSLNQKNPKFQLVIAIWKRLPAFIVRAIGPYLIRGLA